MSQDNGAHVEDGATTDASLASRAKNPKKNSPKWWLIALAVVVVVAVIAGAAFAFGGKKDSKNAASSGTYADTVTIGLKLAPTNLDIRNTAGSALDQILIGNVYEGLVARDSKNQVVPAIASSWETSKDGLTYTFHLNKNMTFSNGDKLDAEDVAWSINELIAKDYHDADALAAVDKVEAKDADTVVITLKSANSNLLWTLTGRPGLVFDKDDKYWGKNKAKTPTVVVKYLADDNAAVNALKSGDVQVLAPITENLAEPFKSDSANYTVKAGDGTDKFVLGFNNASGSKLADKRIRQAIRYAINHKELIASRGGADKALGGPIPSLDPGYEDLTNLYPYDQGKAKSLMAEAGYSADKPLELSLTYANIYGTELGDQLRSQLKPIGIDLKVNVVEFSTWLQDVYTNHDFDISLVDHNESHDFASWTDPTYYFGYDNKDVTKLYNEGVAATSDKERDAKFAEAAKLVSEDAAADWLFNYRTTTATAKGVKGFPLNLNQTVLPLYNVTYSVAEFSQK